VIVDPCLQTIYARRTACTRKRRGALAPHGHYAERGCSRDKHVCPPNLSVADIAGCCRKLNGASVRQARITSHVDNTQKVSSYCTRDPLRFAGDADSFVFPPRPWVAARYTAQHAPYIQYSTSYTIFFVSVYVYRHALPHCVTRSLSADNPDHAPLLYCEPVAVFDYLRRPAQHSAGPRRLGTEVSRSRAGGADCAGNCTRVLCMLQCDHRKQGRSSRL
jgi:hypothetical protein